MARGVDWLCTPLPAGLSARPVASGTCRSAHERERRRPPATPRWSKLSDIIELYKKDVDRSLLREALKLTPDRRVRRLVELTASPRGSARPRRKQASDRLRAAPAGVGLRQRQSHPHRRPRRQRTPAPSGRRAPSMSSMPVRARTSSGSRRLLLPCTRISAVLLRDCPFSWTCRRSRLA